MRDVYLEVSSQVFADSMSQQQLNEYQNAITKSLTPKERQRVDKLDLNTYKERKAYIISNKLNEVL